MKDLTSKGHPSSGPGDSQAGAGMIGVVAMLGLIFALVQGSLFFRTKSSARFLAGEKNKVVAQQVAEAGIEENIADLGSLKVIPASGMDGFATYTSQAVGAGTFTSTLTTLGMGPQADTVLLKSAGRVSAVSQSVSAKLRVRRFTDTLWNILSADSVRVWDSTVTTTVQNVTYVTVVQDPHAMPALNATPAYLACMASSGNKCDVCHIPGGNPSNRHVIEINKNAIHTHISHHGDYVTTDGTCDIYNPRIDSTVTTSTVNQLVTFRDTLVVYDTTYTTHTQAKVQVLSWK
jgi:hypothetical protein